MNRKIIAINCVLIGLIIFEIFSVIQLWSSKDELVNTQEEQAVTPKEFRSVQLFQKKKSPLSAYNDITQHNLFRIERKEYIPEVVAVEPEPTLETNAVTETEIVELDTDKISLFGIIIVGDMKKALVSDVDKTSDRPTIWVKKGDTIDGFLVETVEKDRLVLTNSGKKYSVLLYNKNKPKKREVIQQKTDNSKKVIAAPVKKEVPQVSLEKDDEYEIISTPFGDFKRKKSK